ncbi:MAG: putative O-glycosylation ligase, exosortase A system-associated [Stellaceae bacterium]
MRGLALGIVFFSLLPFIFIKGPFFGILMWFWVSLMNPQQVVWGSIFSGVPYAFVVAVATLASLVVARGEPKLPPANKTTFLLIFLMLWVSVTTWYGIGPPDQLYDKWQLSEKMLFMTLVAYALTNSRVRLEQLILVCVLSIAFWGFRGGLIAIATAGGVKVHGPDGTMIGDNNDLGVALTMILPLIFYLRERYRQLVVKWPMQVLIGLTILGDIFTYSRGALVAITAMGSMLWLRSRNKLQILIVIVVAAVGIWNFAPAEWTARMFTIESYQQDASAEGRIHMWERAWALAQMRPVVGGGFHWSYDPGMVNELLSGTNLPKMESPLAAHSIWFEMLGDHGFVGLLLFVTILASAFVDAGWLIRRTRREPDLAWANNLGRMLQVALVGFCAGGSFATQGMYDGLYAVVIIAAVARRLVAAELAGRKVAALNFRGLAMSAQPAVFQPQPSRQF